MDDIKWIKLAVDIFDNRKIKQIEVMPDGDALIVIWLKILTLAGQINQDGLVYFSKEVPYTEQMLATQFNRPLPTVQLALQTFKAFGMIEIIDDVLMVSNWEKYQSLEGMERVREQTRLRVERHRAKQKQLVGDCNATVTLCNAVELDKELDKELDNNSNVHLNSSFEVLWEMYPKKQGKKQALAAYLRDRKQGFTDEQMKKGLQAYVDHINREKVAYDFIKMGSTFFSQRAWDDDWSGGQKTQESTGGRSDLEDMRRFLESMEG